MHELKTVTKGQQTLALTTSTVAFTVCFAVWTIFSIVGVQVKKDLALNDTEFGLLVATPILTGSLIRLLLGVWTDQYGGRLIFPMVMALSALATWAVTSATTYGEFLVAALGVGIAGGGFAVGIAYVSRWYPAERQGTALGIFGMGNVGAAVTKFCAPWVMVAMGWQAVARIWALVILATSVLFWLISPDDPVVKSRRAGRRQPEPLAAMLAPLREIRVWRFALYYFFVFGGFVALALWLPRYYMGAYGLDVTTAGMLGAAYSIPASVFRAVGGWMSDKWGARTIMYWTFGMATICLFVLSYPATDYVVHGIKGNITFSMSLGFVPFTVTAFVLGFFMSLGKAAVYKHIPHYYPHHVGAVGGIVGLVGGLGGFVLPIAFGALNDLTGVWTSCFMLMFVVVVASLLWMHYAVRRMEGETLRGLGLTRGPALPVGDGLDRLAPVNTP